MPKFFWAAVASAFVAERYGFWLGMAVVIAVEASGQFLRGFFKAALSDISRIKDQSHD